MPRSSSSSSSRSYRRRRQTRRRDHSSSSSSSSSRSNSSLIERRRRRTRSRSPIDRQKQQDRSIQNNLKFLIFQDYRQERPERQQQQERQPERQERPDYRKEFQAFKFVDSQQPQPADNRPFQKIFLMQQVKLKPEELQAYRKQNLITVRSNHTQVPDPVQKFDDLSCFPRSFLEQINKAGFKSPTPIQAQGWSIALGGHDLIGIAQTGSGKTLAFLLPGLIHIQAQQQQMRNNLDPLLLILAPTRELTLQIYEQFQKFSQGSHLYAACLYGGQDKYIQKNQLRRGAQVIIACPGRLIDLVDTGITSLKKVTFLVLDEADRMLDMGFEPQIRKIVSQIRPDRQTMLFSATWPKEVQNLARDFCHEDPVHIQIGNLELTSNMKIKQQVIVLRAAEKQQRLLQLLRDIGRKSRVIIFCATKKGCDLLYKSLERDGFYVQAIHGDKKQNERDYVMNNFKSGKVSILIATDVASRGLDVKDIEYVINYDMPKVIEDYVHRIGRTGRAGASGISISFFAQDEDFRLAKDLMDVLRESKSDIPQELRQVQENSRNQGNNNHFRRWNTPGQNNNMQRPQQQQHQQYHQLTIPQLQIPMPQPIHHPLIPAPYMFQYPTQFMPYDMNQNQ